MICINMSNIIIVMIILTVEYSDSSQIIFKNNSLYSFDDSKSGNGFPQPGTRWCGEDTDEYMDLDEFGFFKETDKCCQTRFFCIDIIHPYETNYNLTNPFSTTSVSCRCDDEFRSCLKSTYDSLSSHMGYFYFNILGKKCFQKEHPIVSCKRTFSYAWYTKCEEYKLDKTKEPIYQWFDVPSW